MVARGRGLGVGEMGKDGQKVKKETKRRKTWVITGD